MQQSIKQWLDTIEDPEVKANALANTKPSNLILQVTCLENSLYLAFIWAQSPQKGKYWSKFMNTLIKKK